MRIEVLFSFVMIVTRTINNLPNEVIFGGAFIGRLFFEGSFICPGVFSQTRLHILISPI